MAASLPPKASKQRRFTLAKMVGLKPDHITDQTEFGSYRRAAEEFQRIHCRYLAKNVGGGTCPPDAASAVTVAAVQLANCHYWQDQASVETDKKLQLTYAQAASKFGNDSTKSLLTAYELTHRTAKGAPGSRKSAAGDRTLGDILDEALES